MADTISKEKRSWIMSRIRGKNTTPEIIVRKFLYSKGYRYRLHASSLPGRPDIVLTKFKTVIFVNGCFWHGHKNCPKARLPKTKVEWWRDKINKNMLKDKRQVKALKKDLWKIITIWQCELKPNKIDSTFNSLIKKINE